ncbi:MAG: (d)CMP kinase [Pseudomonadota bacterium]
MSETQGPKPGVEAAGAVNPVPVVTVDGPSGAGKGTLSVALAGRLGWHFLDSGALYRLTAWQALEAGLALEDVPAVAEAARELDVRFELDGQGGYQSMIGVEPVDQLIRDERVAAAASKVAALQPVRDALLQRQRDFRAAPGLVADGRDMGTVVFPDAPCKIFITASPEERARRRYEQLKAQGAGVTLRALLDDIQARDQRDRERSSAPLKPAADAHLLDTTELTIEAVVEAAWLFIQRQLVL